ncbi:MAG: Cof-type HAD-IIB family hydrolase [Lachnospiraceae bacterium]|nr:Cof-type HAD-IIB family hydrolase [Lachnospiraceae bacterium]
MDIRLIALDMDGTLLNDEKKLSSGNREALEACIRNGIQIVPATGRPAAGIPDFIRNMPGVRYGILTNGARVADLESGAVISESLIPWELTYQVMEFLSAYPVAFDPYIDGRGNMEARFLHHLADYGLTPVMQTLVKSTRNEVEDELALVKNQKVPVEKINIFTADMNLRAELWEKLKQYKELIVTSSLPYNLEINAAAATKGGGLLKLAEHLGIRPEQTMAFGDGSNDLSMIQTAGIGVAMANAMEMLKEQADYITLSNEEDGVAAAIRHFLTLTD